MNSAAKKIRDDQAKQQGRNHAVPVLRSMYPSTSRGEMAKQFEQLFSLGFDAGHATAMEENKQLEEVFRQQCEELREVVSTFDDVQHLGRRLSWSLVTEYKKLKLDSEARAQQTKALVDAVEAMINDVSAPEPFSGVGYFVNTDLFVSVQNALSKFRVNNDQS
jgi:hypothetical protein